MTTTINDFYFNQFESAVVSSVHAKRHENGFTKVCSRETIRESFTKGIPASEAVELAYEDTFYTHGYAKSKD